MSNTIVETSLSFEYVSSWSVKEALRELIQNCIDNSGTVTKVNDALVLNNPDTVLSKQVLYMGITHKRDDQESIGQHGEGLKLALLALTRESETVVITNGTESWRPFFRKNTHGVRVLCVEITELDTLGSSFSIVLDYPKFDLSKLYLGSGNPEEDFNRNYLLRESKYAGMLFSQGLFVSTIDSEFGYNLTGLTLERDRSVITNWTLQDKVVDVWEKLLLTDTTLGQRLAKTLYDGGTRIESQSFAYVNTTPEVNTQCELYFNKLHPDETAVKEGSTVSKGKTRSVSSAFGSALGGSYYSTNHVISTEQRWWDQYADQLSEDAKDELRDILGL